jgi:hypothetical protein
LIQYIFINMNRLELKEIVRQELTMFKGKSSEINEASEVEVKSLSKGDQYKIHFWEKVLKGKTTTAWDGIHGLIVNIDLKGSTGTPRITQDKIKYLNKGPDFRWIEFEKGRCSIGFTAERA